MSLGTKNGLLEAVHFLQYVSHEELVLTLSTSIRPSYIDKHK